jgi:transcriptional regulator with XRE-family HTH domain
MAKDKYLKLVGKRIKQIREDCDMTQENLAYDLSTTKSGVSRIESGESNLTLKTLMRIAQSLGVSIHDLLPKEKES